MQIVDAHVHLYESVAGIAYGQPISSFSHGKVKIGNDIIQFLPPSFERSNSTIETLIGYMDWLGINKALLVPNALYGYHNDYFLTAKNQYPDRFRAFALVDVTKGKEAAAQLSNYVTNEGFYGLKIETDSAFECAPGMNLDDRKLDPVWDCCNELRKTVVLHLARMSDFESFKIVINKFCHIRYIVSHMGAEAVHGKNARMDCFDGLLDIVKNHNNIFLETSAVPLFFKNEDYPFESSCYVIEKANKIVGPEKILWGSDYPGMLSHATYMQLINIIVLGCKNISGQHKEMIMGQNALNLFWNDK